MPRRPRDTNDDMGGQPTQKPTKPEDMSDEQWAIGSELGNVSLAGALLDVTNGKRDPKDAHEVDALMDAARKLESRSYKRYRTLNTTLGSKLAAARADNLNYAQMIQVLRDIEQYGAGAVVRERGAICDQSIDETDQGGPRDPAGDAALDRIAAD